MTQWDEESVAAELLACEADRRDREPFTDDWPERVPVTSAEVDVFEAWFGDVFDELFGPCQ